MNNTAWYRDIFRLPSLSRGWMPVWRRNYRYFVRTILASLFWACFEPILYLIAVGYGLGSMVSDVESLSYVEFFFPALLSTTAMTVAFFESTYGSYAKLTYQKTFATTLLSPVSADEIVFGEILWGASKAFFSILAVMAIATLFGLVHNWMFLPAIVILFITSWLYSALGLYICSIARNYDSFIYAISGFIVPMSLFSGTYFPLSNLPESIRYAAFLLPLTHTVVPVRGLLSGVWSSNYFIHIAVLLMLSFFVTNLAIRKLHRKLIY